MIYRHCSSNKSGVDQIIVRPHYSTTHTQVLITYYIVENLHNWTQDVTNKSLALNDLQNYKSENILPTPSIGAMEAIQNIFPPIYDMEFPKMTSSLKN